MKIFNEAWNSRLLVRNYYDTNNSTENIAKKIFSDEKQSAVSHPSGTDGKSSF